MKQRDKLRVVLPHWLGHNKSHGEEFATWARSLGDDGENSLSSLLMQAALALQEAQQYLEKALSEVGGPQEDCAGPGDHHHHHHHHH